MDELGIPRQASPTAVDDPAELRRRANPFG
jgi:hypothetical protein